VSVSPFFDAAARGELVVPRCVACGRYTEPGADVCPVCGEALIWAAASGDGVVFSYAVVHQVFDPALAGDVPYVIALVDLAEGPRLVTRLVGLDTARPSVGAPVRVTFARLSGRWLPVFRCVSTTTQV
jgi:uncharacterized protein